MSPVRTHTIWQIPRLYHCGSVGSLWGGVLWLRENSPLAQLILAIMHNGVLTFLTTGLWSLGWERNLEIMCFKPPPPLSRRSKSKISRMLLWSLLDIETWEVWGSLRGFHASESPAWPCSSILHSQEFGVGPGVGIGALGYLWKFRWCRCLTMVLIGSLSLFNQIYFLKHVDW